MDELTNKFSEVWINFFKSSSVIDQQKIESELSGAVHAYLSAVVPQIFTVPVDAAKNEPFDSKLLTDHLWKPLIEVLSLGKASTFSALSEVAGLSKISRQICGRVFRNGEATYSCRECATDPTCVLCVTCFTKSQHKDHKYRISASTGSGYCDCGDLEAWRGVPYCSDHDPNAMDNSNSSDAVDPALKQRFEIVVAILIKYSLQVIFSLKLPSFLNVPTSNDFEQRPYQTMLYNDESHSYDDVTKALHAAFRHHCSEDVAAYFASVVDSQGRSCVMVGQLDKCEYIKTIIERESAAPRKIRTSLEVHVLESALVSHQRFALELLTWLSHAVQECPIMLPIICDVLNSNMRFNMSEESGSAVSQILLLDIRMWKETRKVLHMLMMATYLMHVDYKKQFVDLFVEMFEKLGDNYMNDDHEHSCCVISLSTQFFTVPSIARGLIENNFLKKLFSFFAGKFTLRIQPVTETFEFRIQMGNLTWPHHFKRLLTLLSFDVRYLFTSPPKPDEWTPALREGLASGLAALLNFLAHMEGMDAVTRVIGAHAEYDQEWESAFNIQLRLTSLLLSMLHFLSTDKQMLVRAFKLVVAKVPSMQSLLNDSYKVVSATVAHHKATCLVYNVATQPVSIHFPVTRLISGIYLALQKYDIAYDNLELCDENKPTGRDLLELPLRVAVMIAQNYAGMWKRNGFTLLNQIHNYFAPYCRTEMFDRDLQTLQISAALMDPNEFVINVVNRFKIAHWTSEKFGKVEGEITKNLNMIAEEFLHLLIMILGERYVEGIGDVTRDECIKKEIIELLCVKPQPYSKIEGYINFDDYFERSHLDELVRSVANFNKPSGEGPGIFELKSDFLRRFNPFSKNYSKPGMSKAENYQRSLRKNNADPSITSCAPPELPPLRKNFASMTHLFSCDVVIDAMRCVLRRKLSKAEALVTDGQIFRTAFLIGMALNEEIVQHRIKAPNPMIFSTKAAGNASENCECLRENCGLCANLFKLLDRLSQLSDATAYGPLLRWTVLRYKEALALHTSGMEPAAMEVDLESLQNEQAVLAAKRKTAKAAAQQQREKAMAFMSKLQKQFVASNSALLKDVDNDAKDVCEEQEDQVEKIVVDSDPNAFPVCLGPNRTRCHVETARKFTCILCQETTEASFSGPAVVLAAFVQRSAAFLQTIPKSPADCRVKFPLFLNSATNATTQVSTCGHAMHAECWQKYYELIVSRERHRLERMSRYTSYDIASEEYLCPLCKRLSNAVLPALPPLCPVTNEDVSPTNWTSFEDFCQRMQNWIKLKLPVPQKSDDVSRKRSKKSLSFKRKSEPKRETAPCYLLYDYSDDDILASEEPSHNESASVAFKNSIKLFLNKRIFSSTKTTDTDFSPLTEMLRLFSQSVYTIGLKVHKNELHPNVPVVLWLACAHSIRCLQGTLDIQMKPLFGALTSRQSDCLHCLTYVTGSQNLYLSNPGVIKDHLVRLLRPFLISDDAKVVEHFPCILEIDCWNALVSMCMCVENLRHGDPLFGISTENMNFLVFRLILNAYVLQSMCSLLVTNSMPECLFEVDPLDVDHPLASSHNLFPLFTKIAAVVGYAVKPELTPDVLWRYLKYSLTPFLSCAALYFHAVTLVAPPEALKDPAINSFQPLCRYLSLPQTWNDWVSFLSIDLMKTWCQNPNLKKLVNTTHTNILTSRISRQIIIQPAKIRRLIKLPNAYTDLIALASKFECEQCRSQNESNPALCLLCGEMVCFQNYSHAMSLPRSGMDLNDSSSDSGDQSSENEPGISAVRRRKPKKHERVMLAAHHAYMCGAQVGMQLRIRDCYIILVGNGGKKMFSVERAPYVDQFGETDPGFRRGNPLHLSHESYNKLEQWWLNHSITERITNQIESGAHEIGSWVM